jgi:hypothetical protein
LYRGGFHGDQWSDGGMSCTFCRLKNFEQSSKGTERSSLQAKVHSTYSQIRKSLSGESDWLMHCPQLGFWDSGEWSLM